MKDGLLQILNDTDSAGQGRKRDEEKNQRGERKNEKVFKRMKNEKVA